MNKRVKICIFDKDTTKDVVILSNGNAILDNICTYCKVHENLDGTYEIDAEFILDDEGLYKYINDEDILKVQLDYGNEYFRIINTRKTRNSIVVYGRQITIYESMHLWLSNVRPTGINGIGALNWMLEGATGVKELEVFSDISNSNTSYFIDMNMYQALHDSDNSFQNRWGGEVLRRGYLLSILTRVGTDRGVQIRSKKNLTGFEYETNTELVTRIKPKGFDGITIQGFIDSPLINNYARVYTKEIKYEDVKVKGEEDEEGFDTLAEAQAELTRLANLEYTDNKVDIVQANYNISFIDLSTTEEYKNYIQAERVYIGDTVSVYEDKFDCNIQVRAIDRIYNVLTQRVEEITLSNKDIATKTSYSDTLLDIAKGIENNDNSIAKWIQSFIQTGIKDSYVFYNKAELVVCDNANLDEAIHVWRFNKNGLAHSSTGYQGPYDVAITADGKINASMILGGLLKGQFIDAKNLIVRDSNDNITLSIDSEGNLYAKGNISGSTFSSINNTFKVNDDGSVEAINLDVSQEVETNKLIVNEIANTKYPKVLDTNIRVYIDENATESASTFWWGATYKSIDDLKSVCPRNLNGYTLVIQFNSDYNQNIHINFLNSGYCNLELRGKTINGSIKLEGLQRFMIYGSTSGGTSSDFSANAKLKPATGYTYSNEDYALYFSETTVKIYNVDVYRSQNERGSGINLDSAKAFIRYIKFVNNPYIAVRSNVLSWATIYNTVGLAKKYFGVADTGIINYGATTQGGVEEGGTLNQAYNNGQIFATGATFTSETATGTGNTSTSTTVTKTATITSTSGDNYRYAGNGASTSAWVNESKVKQGYWSYGNRVGLWFFGSQFGEYSTKNITKVEITITRNAGGQYAAVPLAVRLHNHESKPSTAPSFVASSTFSKTLNIATGTSGTITLTSTADINAFKNAKGIGLCPASFSQANYAVCSSICNIKITYKE